MKKEMKIEHQAFKICTHVLNKNLTREGLFAGSRHFTDSWARDTFFSCFALFKLKQYNEIKSLLLLFIRFQKKDGQIPLRIGRGNQLLKFLNIPSRGKLNAVYTNDKGSHPALDSTILFLTIFSTYILKTKNNSFFRIHKKKLDATLSFLENHETNNLLYQNNYTDWADSIKKKGTTLYSNTLYYQAITLYAQITHKEQSITLKKKAEDLKKNINNQLWNTKGHFNDWKYKKTLHTNFCLESNLLAILTHLANKEQTQKILNKIQHQTTKNKKKGIPITSNLLKNIIPPYTWKQIFLPFYFINMQSYHNGMCWLWHTNLSIEVLAKHKKTIEAKTLLNNVAKIITQHQTTHEVYTPQGKPLHKLFYTSEPDFSWSAATYIQAYKSIVK